MEYLEKRIKKQEKKIRKEKVTPKTKKFYKVTSDLSGIKKRKFTPTKSDLGDNQKILKNLKTPFDKKRKLRKMASELEGSEFEKSFGFQL